jgi:hypothetical protein
VSLNCRSILCFVIGCFAIHIPALAQQAVSTSDTLGGVISGTVMDTDDNVISGATVALDGSSSEAVRTTVSGDDGEFTFANVRPEEPHIVRIRVAGHLPWSSPSVTVDAGGFFLVRGIRLKFSGGVTSVTVTASSTEIATEQLKAEERQRVFGVIPNFYVSYDANPQPLTPKMKFALALKFNSDPVTFLGAALFAGVDQAADTPHYGRGSTAYAQRLGANYANMAIDNVVGNAVLASLLHQDPRYFYKGSGSTKSRLAQAAGSAFICRGDDGRLQPNYSEMGGDLVAGAISNLYYPSRDRGGGLVLQNAAITAGARVVDGLLQEFVLRRFTTHTK